MKRSAFAAASLLLLVFVLGCGGGGDDSPTAPGSTCSTAAFAPSTLWVIQGGCEGTSNSIVNGFGAATYDAATCALTMDITPPSVKAAGGTWKLQADLRNGTASVVRSNVECPNTDTGTVRIEQGSVIAEVRAPADPNCACRLNYAVNVSQAK